MTNLDHASPDIVPALGTVLCWWKSSRLCRPITALAAQLDSALKEVFRRLGRLVGRHPLLFLVVPMVASTILSTGRFHVAGKNNLSYRRIYSNYFHALQDLINVPSHTGERVRHSPHPPHLLF